MRGIYCASETRKMAIKLIKEKIRRNQACPQRKLVRHHNFSETTIHRIIKDDEQMLAFKCRMNELYVASDPQERLLRANLL